MNVSPALNEMKLGFHLVRARWNWGFIRFRSIRSTRISVLAVPAGLKSYFWARGA